MPGTPPVPQAEAPPRVRLFEDWSLHEYAVCTSTNLVAANLPAWSAVRAETQTRGRGRFERGWVSDAGGLWMSAVLPVQQKSEAWRFLPVAVGFAVCQTLGALGVTELRLRWPNDILVGNRKLSGLLLDQFAPDRVVVGIGINVANHPESQDGSLRGQTVRLSDILQVTPDLTSLAVQVLRELRSIQVQLAANGPEPLLPGVNSLWKAPRRVRLELDSEEIRGDFMRVDAAGRLELSQPGLLPRFFEPQQVRCLREIDEGK